LFGNLRSSNNTQNFEFWQAMPRAIQTTNFEGPFYSLQCEGFYFFQFQQISKNLFFQANCIIIKLHRQKIGTKITLVSQREKLKPVFADFHFLGLFIDK
jgi:hypothetical protein